MRRLVGAILAAVVAITTFEVNRTLAQSDAPAGAIGWIGLFTPGTIEWLENQNRLASLCPGDPDKSVASYDCRRRKLTPEVLVIRLRKAPDVGAAFAGNVVVVAVPGVGLSASFVAPGGGAGRPVHMDLQDGDWGYGPYFHMTVVERRGKWVRLPEDPFPPSTWLNVDDLGPEPPFQWVEPGDIVTSPIGDLFVLGVGPGLVRARPEQDRDMPCGERQAPVAPFTELRLEGDTLFTPTGHLRLHIKYTRGC